MNNKAGVSEAKIAASFCADTLGKKIVDFNFQGLNVMIGKDGDLSIIIKFENIGALKILHWKSLRVKRFSGPERFVKLTMPTRDTSLVSEKFSYKVLLI